MSRWGDDYPFERPDFRDEDPYDPGPQEDAPEPANPLAPQRSAEVAELWQLVYGPPVDPPRRAHDAEDWYV